MTAAGLSIASMSSAGPSPPDPPKLSWLGRDGVVRCCHPDVAGPRAVGRLPLDGRQVVAAAVTPSGSHIVSLAEYNSWSTHNRQLLSARLPDLRTEWNHPSTSACADSLRHGHALGDSVCTGSCETHYLYTPAVSGKFICGSLGDTQAAVTVPWQSPLCGHYATIAANGMTGHAPDGSELWVRESVTCCRRSACGHCYESEYTLLDVRTGAVVAAFSLSPVADVCIAAVGAIDSERYLCVISTGDEPQFVILAAADSRCLARGAHVSHDYVHPHMSLLPNPSERRSTAIAVGRSVVIALNRAANVLHMWHLNGAVLVWEWPPSQCARYEYDRATAAVDAVDAVDAVATDAVGLVRAVLAGFVAEESRLLWLQLRS